MLKKWIKFYFSKKNYVKFDVSQWNIKKKWNINADHLDVVLIVHKKKQQQTNGKMFTVLEEKGKFICKF